jgi:riboflavin kinase / FMN adenylyltransferase
MPTTRLNGPATAGLGAQVVTVGNFDGVHTGHQSLARTAVDLARRSKRTAAALTFDPHPAQVLAPERAPQALTTLEQKALLLGELGLTRVIVLPFTMSVAALSAEEFVRRFLLSILGAQCVVVGAAFRFGRGRRGDVATLRGLGASLGFDVVGVDPVQESGEAVSSTRIRGAVRGGDVRKASMLLGRPYAIEGTIARGDGRGRTLGFPTLNLSGIEQLLPLGGVYAGRCHFVGGGAWPAVVNIGRRPTFGGERTLTEAHLLGFSAEVYGRRVALDFHDRIRDERRFEGADALRGQIRADIAEAERLARR